jgi:hypothetical protein
VAGGAQGVISILDGTTSTDRYAQTNFGEFGPGDFNAFSFTVYNRDRDTPLVLNGPILISGPNAASFEISGPPNSPIPAGSSTDFTVAFQSEVVGAHNATITINSNDADPGQQAYTFAVKATKVALPLAGVDLRVEPLAFKSKVKNGLISVKGKLQLSNDSSANADAAIVKIYTSSDDMLDPSDELVHQFTPKVITGQPDGGTVKFFTSNVKFTISQRGHGYLIFQIDPNTGIIPDANYGGNTSRLRYGIFGEL